MHEINVNLKNTSEMCG